MALDVCAATANIARDAIDDLELGLSLAASDYGHSRPSWLERAAARYVGYVSDNQQLHEQARRAIIEMDRELGAQKRILGREVMNAGACAARVAIAPRRSAASGKP